MAVKVRLARIGKKKIPFYRIVAIDSRSKRDGEFLEDLGTYDAVNSTLITFHADRIQYWLSKGAIATDTVKKLCKMFKKHGIQAPVAIDRTPAAPKAAEQPEAA